MSTAKKPSKIVILALGNPGEEYEDTYHNAGTIALPAIIRTLTGEDAAALAWRTHRHLFEYAPAGNFIFARSLTYMNESGLAAAEALKKFGIQLDHFVVVHDESDLTVGNCKVSFDRSSGGHKGVESIQKMLRTRDFVRVRIGISPRTPRGKARKPDSDDVIDFVLGRFKSSEAERLKSAQALALDALHLLLTEGLPRAMTEINARDRTKR